MDSMYLYYLQENVKLLSNSMGGLYPMITIYIEPLQNTVFTKTVLSQFILPL